MAVTQKRLGLVLTGGGARAAYQAGVLQGMVQVLAEAGLECHFDVLAGVSAGAINAAFLAGRDDNFRAATDGLHELWRDLRIEQVFRTDPKALSGLAARWLRDVSLGGMTGASRSTHLLDASPLRALLAQHIDLDAVRTRIARGHLRGLALTATSYATGTAIHFYEGAADILPWQRAQRLSVRTELHLDHVLASAAIPFLFRPVRIGNTFFGDGAIRLTTPLSPAVHLGANRIVAIGNRHDPPRDSARQLNDTACMTSVTLSDIAGTALDAIFLDSLEDDADRMIRSNLMLALFAEEVKSLGFDPLGLRAIPLLMLRPSEHLGRLAADQFERFPFALRYMLRGLGASKEKGWDLLSYLAFEPGYTHRLMDLGREDARRNAEAIVAFFGAE